MAGTVENTTPAEKQLAQPTNNTDNDRSEHEETLPGWTIMRPLKMRGLKRNGGSKGHVQLPSNTSSMEDNKRDSTRKGEDVEVTETNGSVNGSNRASDFEPLADMRSDDELLGPEHVRSRAVVQRGGAGEGLETNGYPADEAASTNYKVYKRRWFGLVQVMLLNIIVSWDWLSFAANSTTTSQYYNTSSSNINWLSTAFLFAFVASSPITIYTLHHGGPKPAILTASVLILIGNWIRYGATRSGEHGNFAGVMVGQILIGFGQPFVLSAPTRYSDLWFTNRGRIAATAVMSLANPFGGALAQLVDPFWAGTASDIPNMVLYIAVISSVATIPSFFIPAAPPTPPSASGTDAKYPLWPSLKILAQSPEFYMIMIPFTLYVGLFNSVASLINQILEPYGFTEDEAGIAGALLIVVGLVSSAITSPIIDRKKSYLTSIKILVPFVGASYLAFVWAPQTRTLVAPYVILAIMGGTSFSLVPVVLEYIVEITHPISPEITSTICWTGGQLFGGIFIIVEDALKAPGGDSVGTGHSDNGSTRPPGNLFRALVFQAVLALAVVPLPLMLGLFGRKKQVRMRRVDADSEAAARRGIESGGVGVAI